MAIKGIKSEKKGNTNVFWIESFDDELKTEIRNNLASIYHGFAHAESNSVLFNYKNTIKLFYTKFKTKTQLTQKGMIGELLTHLLLNHYEKSVTSISILKNKEETSIKKGFDVLYYHAKNDKIYYSEVKSGRSGKKALKSNNYNSVLLSRSHKSLSTALKSKRDTLWESALIDVELTIKQNKKKKSIKEILVNDIPIAKKKKTKKNAILISVLYHDLSDKLDITEVFKKMGAIKAKNKYSDLIVFSIQKATYEKIKAFLKSEAA